MGMGEDNYFRCAQKFLCDICVTQLRCVCVCVCVCVYAPTCRDNQQGPRARETEWEGQES